MRLSVLPYSFFYFLLGVIVWLLQATSLQAQTDSLHHKRISLPPFSEIREIHNDTTLNVRQKTHQYGNFFVRIIDAFDDIDTNYVERIPYNFTAMLQSTRNFESYTIGSDDYATRLAFAERANYRVGPYFGWRWLFFGYTFDVAHFGRKPKNQGVNLNFSLYTSKLGVDLLYRRTGSNFFLRRIEGLGDDALAFEGSDANDYIQTSVTGIKFYWIFNNHRFSNPAIYSQSTIQRRSAGSFQLGLNFSLHDIHFNYEALPAELLKDIDNENIFSSLERVKYTSVSLQVGYAYNWVFARNWCFGISVQPALSYQLASTKTAILMNDDDALSTEEDDDKKHSKLYGIFRQRSSLGLDLTGRSGLIYNTGRWFVGLTGIMHNYNYHRDEIRFNNVFGSANLFVGFYFQKKKVKSDKPKVMYPEPVREVVPVVEY
ncbi:MAG: DUF4421 domain-containing protein [Bacteroidales bacterium]|nr:DUF4421 domain-containing protein [Bacteroidales bacterium]